MVYYETKQKLLGNKEFPDFLPDTTPPTVFQPTLPE